MYNLVSEETGGETEPGLMPDAIKSVYDAAIPLRQVKLDHKGNEIKDMPTSTQLSSEAKKVVGYLTASCSITLCLQGKARLFVTEEDAPQCIGE